MSRRKQIYRVERRKSKQKKRANSQKSKRGKGSLRRKRVYKSRSKRSPLIRLNYETGYIPQGVPFMETKYEMAVKARAEELSKKEQSVQTEKQTADKVVQTVTSDLTTLPSQGVNSSISSYSTPAQGLPPSDIQAWGGESVISDPSSPQSGGVEISTQT